MELVRFGPGSCRARGKAKGTRPTQQLTLGLCFPPTPALQVEQGDKNFGLHSWRLGENADLGSEPCAWGNEREAGAAGPAAWILGEEGRDALGSRVRAAGRCPQPPGA